MADELSREERDALLAIDGGASRSAGVPAAANDFAPSGPATREQLRQLAALHQDFPRKLGEALSSMLRTPVRVKWAAVEQVCYGELLRGLESPTYYCVLRAAPLTGGVALDAPLSLVLPMLDRMLGGGGTPGPIEQRPLSDIELRLAGRLAARVLDELRAAWQPCIDVQFAVERVESDPRTARLALPNEIVLRLALEVSMQHACGLIGVCLTRAAAVTLIESLSPIAGNQVVGTAVSVVAQLAEVRLRSDELSDLRAGDILATDQRIDGPIIVSIDGVPRFHARAGAHEGRRAVQIEGPIEPGPGGV